MKLMRKIVNALRCSSASACQHDWQPVFIRAGKNGWGDLKAGWRCLKCGMRKVEEGA